jgi:hypothetical protein
MDLRPFLPHNWQANLDAIGARAQRVQHADAGPGSLSANHQAGLDYWHASGLTDSWLVFLHQVTIPALHRVAGISGLVPVTESHGITVNVLRPDESTLSGLEWHVDGSDVERVVILTPRTWTAKNGGRLFTHDGCNVRGHDLYEGHGLSVATGITPHAVEAPRTDRVSLMFAYTSADAPARAADQSTYIGATP